MRLVPVDPEDESHVQLLWDLHQLRPEVAKVSSKGCTQTFEGHREFVRAHPYAEWCLIEACGKIVGSVFISQPMRPSVVGDELSSEIFPAYQREGYAYDAVRAMERRHPRPKYFWNVSPENYASMALAQKLGGKPCQVTFELVAE